MNTLPLLVKREYWEHRGGFLWTPFWIATTILILTVLGMISAEILRTNAHVQMGFSLDALRNSISAGDIVQAGNGLDMAQMMFVGITSIGVFFVLFFYLLGALYDDRRDRSVLFWKSLPVTDTATVASKALAALVLAPALALAVATIAYLAFLVLLTAWTGVHGLNPLPVLAAAHPFGMFWRLVLTLPIDALWALPAVGWLLFWSAWVRSKPFLWAVLLPIVAVFANWWLGKFGAPHIGGDFHLAAILGRLIFSIMPGSWLGQHGLIQSSRVSFRFEDDHVVSSLDPSRIYGILGDPNVWIGVVVGLALLAAAVWFRQRRIETAS